MPSSARARRSSETIAARTASDGVDLLVERDPDGPARRLRVVRREDVEPVPVDADHLGARGGGLAAERLAVRDEGVGVVGVHVVEDAAGVRAQRVGFGGGVLGEVDPAHSAEAADVADGRDVEPVEPEVVEGRVERAGVRGLVAGEDVVALGGRDDRDLAEDGDARERERVGGVVGGGDHERGPRIGGDVPAVLGEVGQAQQRHPVVADGVGDQRAEGVAGLLHAHRRQRPGTDLGEQRPRAFGVAGHPPQAGSGGERAAGPFAGVGRHAVSFLRSRGHGRNPRGST